MNSFNANGLKRGQGQRNPIWQYNQAWDYAQTNDKEIWEKEPEPERLIEADTLTKKSPEQGFYLLMNLAESGSTWAMYLTGFNYSRGRGVSRDIALAERWYRLSFEAGCNRAMLDLGHLVARQGDLEEAEAVAERGAVNDWAPALFWLAYYRLTRSASRQTFLEVRPLLERAATQGSPGAIWTLARYMITGRLGLREIPHGVKLLLELVARMNAERSPQHRRTHRPWAVSGS